MQLSPRKNARFSCSCPGASTWSSVVACCCHLSRMPRDCSCALARAIISGLLASTVCRCTPSRQRRKQLRLRAAPSPQKILHVGARFDHQRPAQFPVKRVLHDHVEHAHAVIHQNLQLFLGPFRACAGRQLPRGAVSAARLRRQPVALRRGKNVVPARRAEWRRPAPGTAGSRENVAPDSRSGHRAALRAHPFAACAAGACCREAGRVRATLPQLRHECSLLGAVLSPV